VGHSRQPCTPYICQWRHVTDEYSAHIFIGDVALAMNIWGGSKLNWTGPIFVSVPCIFIGFGTGEYNLNYIGRY
jgi:hypothetical protein